jgi:L-lactate dehydrogenase
VRLPGERGYQLAASQAQDGVQLHAGILPALQPWARKYGVAMPGASA